MDLKTRWESSIAPTYATPTLQLDRGAGVHVWDASGKRYLDFISGIAVCSTGHAHPTVVRAIADQAGRLMHTSNLYATDNVMRLAEKLQQLTGYHRAFFCNSGAEANEFALKIVRRHANVSGKPGAVVIALDQSFHGRLGGTVALTGNRRYQQNFGPLPAQIVHVRANNVNELEAAFARQPVAGIFLEPIQGESGVRPLNEKFLAAVFELAAKHDALVVADEVQTGVGRTGKFLAQERWPAKPDITCLAKGIASGFPLGTTLLNERVTKLLSPGDHGSTFGGNPLACAAGLATLDVIEKEQLVANAEKQGAHLRETIAKIPGVKETRGFGLLVGVELTTPTAKKVKADAESAGLLVNAIGETVLRLAPPLILTTQQADEAVAILAKCIAQ